jgi:ClpP class serine protease
MGIALQAILKAPWAIEQGALDLICDIAAREHEYADGDLTALEQKLGRPLDNTYAVTNRDGVAVIPIMGPLFRRANLFTRISGATSYDTIAQDLQAAIDDPTVSRILLNIDSPGGEVNGNSQLAAYVRAAVKTKPVDAFIGGTGASAAYWMAVSATRVYAADTALIGSIGVQMGITVQDPQQGQKSYTFKSSQSPNKNASPDTKEGAADIQQMIDGLAAVFVDTVAEYRGTTTEDVLANFGQGAVFVAKDALARGMIDGITTFEGLLSTLSTEVQAMDYSKLTAADLTANRADLVAAIKAEVQQPDVAAIKAQAAKDERERIVAIDALAMDGTDAIVAACKADGTSAADAAMKIIAAAKALPPKAAAPANDPAANALDVLKNAEEGNKQPAAGRENEDKADPFAALASLAAKTGAIR